MILRESNLKTAKRREGRQIRKLRLILGGWTRRTRKREGKFWADGIALFRGINMTETCVF